MYFCQEDRDLRDNSSLLLNFNVDVLFNDVIIKMMFVGPPLNMNPFLQRKNPYCTLIGQKGEEQHRLLTRKL